MLGDSPPARRPDESTVTIWTETLQTCSNAGMDRSQAGHRDYCNKKIATWLGIGSRCSSSSSSSSSLYKGEEKEEERRNNGGTEHGKKREGDRVKRGGSSRVSDLPLPCGSPVSFCNPPIHNQGMCTLNDLSSHLTFLLVATRQNQQCHAATPARIGHRSSPSPHLQALFLVINILI